MQHGQPIFRGPIGLAARLGAVSFAALLASCAAVGPDYREPAAAAPQQWNGAAAARFDADSAGDLSAWWQRLNDPTLSALIGRALAANVDLQSAQARLREARARRLLAGAQHLPTVSASGSASTTRAGSEALTARDGNYFSAGLDASWEPDVFGGLRRGIEAAQADLQSSIASLQSTQVSLVAEVGLSYVDLRAAQRRLAIARDNLERQRETLQLTRWRAQAGLVGELDVEQSRATVEQTAAAVPALETAIASAGHRLAILLAQAPGSLQDELAAQGEIPLPPQRIAVGIPADALRQRPDVRAAERRVAAETARIGQAEANRYPGFTLTGSVGLDALTIGGLSSSAALTRSLAAGVAGVLFDGGRRRQAVEIQDAIAEQAVASYRSTVLSALEDVENALVALQNSERRQAALGNAATAARSAAGLARHRYTSGLIDFQAVIDTERSVLTIEDSLASAQADGATAVIRLYKALGGGWSGT